MDCCKFLLSSGIIELFSNYTSLFGYIVYRRDFGDAIGMQSQNPATGFCRSLVRTILCRAISSLRVHLVHMSENAILVVVFYQPLEILAVWWKLSH
ncbi:hypothetical protein KC335_g31 [Hortaea werneckii]|nr:hypothetical protein KC335_g31 [Hortaea werneckii]